MVNLLQRMAQDVIPELGMMKYSAWIEECGPIDKIVEDAMTQIEPEVLELQGKNLSAEL